MGTNDCDVPKVLKYPEVRTQVGLSRTTLWRAERAGKFPRRLRLGPNSVGWLASEVRDWLESRPRGMAGGNR